LIKRTALVLALLSSQVSAAEIDSLVERALSSYPEVKIAEHALRSARYSLREAYSSYLPRVSLTYSYTRLSDAPSIELFGKEVALVEKSFREGLFLVEYPLFTGGKRGALVKLKKSRVNLAREELGETLLKVKSDVKKSYYEVLKAKALVRAAQASLDALREHYKTVKAFYDEGIATKRELLEAQVALKRGEERLEAAKGAYLVALERLRTLVGLNSFEPKEELSLEVRALNFSLEELLQLALKNRPLLRAAEAGVDAARAGTKAARSEFLPKINLSFSYTKSDRYPGAGELSYTSASVALSLPLFEGGKRFWRVKEARERELMEVERVNLLKKKVRLEVVAAYTRAKSLEKRVESAKKRVEEARELLRESKERYKERVGVSTEVVDAVAALEEARSSLIEAVAELLKAQAEIERATGLEEANAEAP